MYQKFQLKIWHDHMPLKRKFEIYPYSAQWGIRNIKISLSDWIAWHDKDKWLTSLTWLYVVICLCTSQLLCVLSWLPLSFTRVLIILCFVSLISCTFIALQTYKQIKKATPSHHNLIPCQAQSYTHQRTTPTNLKLRILGASTVHIPLHMALEQQSIHTFFALSW